MFCRVHCLDCVLCGRGGLKHPGVVLSPRRRGFNKEGVVEWGSSPPYPFAYHVRQPLSTQVTGTGISWVNRNLRPPQFSPMRGRDHESNCLSMPAIFNSNPSFCGEMIAFFSDMSLPPATFAVQLLDSYGQFDVDRSHPG